MTASPLTLRLVPLRQATLRLPQPLAPYASQALRTQRRPSLGLVESRSAGAASRGRWDHATPEPRLSRGEPRMYSRASAGTMVLQSLASPGRWSIMVRCAVAPRASPGARRSVPAARLREASLAEQARFLRSGPAPLLAPVRLSEPRVAVPAGAGLSVSSQSTPARSRAGQHTNTRSHNSLNSIAGLVSWLLPALACGARPEKRRPAAAHKRTRAGLGGYPSPAVNALLQLRGPAH